MPFTSLLIVGCGNMGGAMLNGWLAGGIAPGSFTIADPALKAAPAGVKLLREIPQTGEYDAILLAVKPQSLGSIAADIAPLAGPGTTVLSILAGVELATLAELFPRAAGHVRVMPNLAAAMGKSPIGLAAGAAQDAIRGPVDALMAPLGTAEWLTDEGLMDAVTALVGSGPAFVYRFIDALAAGAEQLGMPAEQAQRLALAMVEGAGLLAASSPHSPGDLARMVASPGGTTQAGLSTLDHEDALARLVEATLRSARDRGAEMAAETRR